MENVNEPVVSNPVDGTGASQPLVGYRTTLTLLVRAYFTLVGLWGSVHFWLCGRALAKQKT